MIKELTFCLLLLSFPPFVFAISEDEGYEAIVTLDNLFMVIDKNAIVTKFKDQRADFTHYYSASLDRSFLVDDELGQVCHTYKGRRILSCFPCDVDEVSTHCP